MYFDTSYIAKFYLNEADSPRVRTVVQDADSMTSSFLAFAELHGVLSRKVREQTLSRRDARLISELFSSHVSEGLWTLIPLSERCLRRASKSMLDAPASLFLRTADAIHLTSAADAGEDEVWTSDRHMLAAGAHFGVRTRSV